MSETYNQEDSKKVHKANKKKLVTIVLGVVVLAVLTFGGMYLAGTFRDPNVLATVGGQKITKADLNARIYATDFGGTPQNPTAKIDQKKKKDLLNELINDKIVAIEAPKLGISVSDAEVNSEVVKRASSYSKQTQAEQAISREMVREALFDEKLKEKVLGDKEGSYILVNYSKNFESNMSITPEQKAKEDIGRAQRIQDDTSYAKNLIDSIYADVKSGKMTFEQGMNKAKNDPRFGVEGYQPNTVLQSDNFDKNDYYQGTKIFSLGQNDEVKSYLDNMKPGEVSQPIAVKVEVIQAGDTGKSEAKDGIWLIVKLKKNENQLADSYDEWLQAKRKELDTTILDKTFASLKTVLRGKTADAHSGVGITHGCANTDHWGINTGSSGSDAGLVVHTVYYDASGGGPYDFNKSVNVFGNNGGVVHYNSSTYTNDQNLSGKAFNTGDPWFYTGGSCSNTGYLVLGWGTTSGTGENGHFGNTWALNCQYNNFVVNFQSTDQGPGNYGGYWDSTSQGFAATNGSTTRLTFTWHENPAPYHSPIGYLDSASCDASGNLTVKGWTCDPDDYSDPNRVRLHYDIGSGPYPADDNNLPNTITFSPSDDTTYPNLIMPNVYRPDVAASCGGNANHGFNKTIPAPSAIRDGNPHYITAFGLDWFPWSINGTGFIQHTPLPLSVIQNSVSYQYQVTCPSLASTISNSCPTLKVNGGDSATVQQGTPVTLSWGGGNNVSKINIEQHPNTGTLANINGVTVSGGSLQVIPSVTTTYDLAVTYSDNTSAICPGSGIPVTVNSNQTGSESPAPPH